VSQLVISSLTVLTRHPRTSVGGAVGVIINAFINDKWGRKVGFITAALFTLLGVGLTAGSRSVVMLIIGRFILFLGGWGGCTGKSLFKVFSAISLSVQVPSSTFKNLPRRRTAESSAQVSARALTLAI
jgi:MFS family permease